MIEKPVNLSEIVQMATSSQLASIREILSGIIEIINNPHSSIKDLKDLIKLDPPLTAKILISANSAYYGSSRKISDIEQAVIWIGFEEVKEIALCQKVCEIFNSDATSYGYSQASLWKHSVAVALLSKSIYRREFGERGENAYAAGLLHDIGIIVEEQFFKQIFKKILKKTKDDEINLAQSEVDVLGYSHAEIGMALADYWNFPEELVKAIGFHNHPNLKEDSSMLSSTIFISEYLCQDIGYGDVPVRKKYFFYKYLHELNIKPHAMKLIFNDVKKELSKMQNKGFFTDDQKK